MTITLNPQTEARLRAKASREGRTPDTVADAILGDVLDAEAQEQAETVSAVQRATVAAMAGREKPLEQYLAEQRAKRGLSESWPSATLVETEAGLVVAE